MEFWREIIGNLGDDDSVFEVLLEMILLKLMVTWILTLMHCRVTTLVIVKRVMKTATLH